MMQSWHKLAHVTTAQLSWHVQICGLIASAFVKIEHYGSLWDMDYELINSFEMGPMSHNNNQWNTIDFRYISGPV